MGAPESDLLRRLGELIVDLSAIRRRAAADDQGGEPEQRALRDLAVAAEKMSCVTPFVEERVSVADWGSTDTITARLQLDEFLDATAACRVVTNAAAARLDGVRGGLRDARRLLERVAHVNSQ